MSRVLLVDDHKFLTEVLAAGLRGADLETHVLDVDQDILPQAEAFDDGVIVLDLQLGHQHPSGEDLIKPLVAMGYRVIVLSGVTDDHSFARCLEFGAAGVLEKTADYSVLIDSIVLCLAGEPVPPGDAERARMAAELEDHRRAMEKSRQPFDALSPKEGEVLAMIMSGQSAAEISSDLYVSLATVRTHIKAVTRKLNVTSQLQAVALAHHVGWSNETEQGKTKPEPEAAGPIERADADNRASRPRR